MKHTLGPILLVLMALTLFPHEGAAGEWGVGVGIALNQAPHRGVDTDIVGGPFPFYEGERLSVGFGSMSYRLINSDKLQFSLLGRARFDGYDPDKSSALSGMQKRDPSFDVGFSAGTGGLWGIASLTVSGDALGVHKGFEVSALYEYPIQLRRWTIVPSVGVNWRSAELIDYYYGVRATEASSSRAQYNGRAATNVSVGLSGAYKINGHWSAIGGVEYVRLSDSIQSSPIIESNHEASVFSALVYRF